MENKVFTKEDILDITINLLGSIQVPVYLYNSISKPLAGALENLNIIKQLLRAEADPDIQKAEEDRPDEEATDALSENGERENP